MRRIVNLRIMLVAAVSEICFILILCLTNVNLFAGISSAIVFMLLIIGLSVFAKCKNYLKLFAAFAVSCGLAAVTAVSFAVTLSTFHTVVPESDIEYTVIGNVNSVIDDNGIILGVTVSNATVNGEKIRGKIKLVFGSENIAFDELLPGYTVTASGDLYKVELISGGKVNGTAYRKNIRYNLYVSQSGITYSAGKADFLSSVRAALYTKLRLDCGYKYGSIAYCMLTGDKSELDETTTRLYTIAGIGHVLAVSGLHVGIIVAVISFILKKLRVHKFVALGIITALLILYCVFTGMSPSVIRASVMCVIGLFAMATGMQKDALSTLSFAFALMVAAEPFILFEVGFAMSFSAVFGLVLFARTFNKYLRKIHIPKFLSVPLSATLSVHIGVLPISVYFFGAVQTYSIIVNILLIPLLTVTFAAILIVAPVSFIFNLSVPFRICASGFALSDIVINFVGNMHFATVCVKSDIWLFALYPAYFAASRFFMLPRFKRVISVTVFALCAVAVAVPSIATRNYSSELDCSVIPVNGYGDVTTVFVDDGVTVIGDLKDTAALKSVLISNNIRKIDMIVINSLSENVGNKLADFVCNYSVGKIICPIDNITSEGLAALGNYNKFYVFEESHTPKVKMVYNNDKFVGYKYDFDDSVSVLTAGYSARYTDFPAEIIDTAPIIRCFMYLNEYYDRIYLTNMPSGYMGETPKYQFGLAETGGYIYKVPTGEILKTSNA